MLVSPSELAEHLHEPGWAIVDCRFSLDDPERGRESYRAGHIPGAVYAHLDEDLSGEVVPGRTGRHPLPSPDEFAETLSAWGVGEGVRVVAYDAAGGAIAARLWWMLRWLGHDDVAVLDGGWPRWLREEHHIHSGVESRAPRPFQARPRPELVAHADEVAALRTDPACRLVDARAAERYRGEVEPIDLVAGHIPGARSLPYAENLDEAGNFLPPEALRARFREALGDVPEERIVVYCGSGVTAAHDLFALARAGLPGARLYPGSWSEWITDPDRPVATGEDA